MFSRFWGDLNQQIKREFLSLQKDVFMKNKTIISAIFILLVNFQVFGQKNWDIYTFGNICSFRIPPTLELRNIDAGTGKVFNKAVDQLSIKYGQTPADREMKFQPKGLNSNNKEDVAKATAVYSRILIADLNGDFPAQNDIAKLTIADIKEIDAIFKKDVIKYFSYSNSDQKVEWFPLTRIKVDGKYALVSTYKRPSINGGCVYVREYKFFLTAHLLRITISYRENESYLWKQDFDKFISTLSFN